MIPRPWSEELLLPRPHFHPVCHRPRCAASDGTVVFRKKRKKKYTNVLHLENGFYRKFPSAEPPILENTENITPPKISAFTVY